MKISKGLRQAYELQDFCHEAALALRAGLLKDGKLTLLTREDAQAIKALISSWRDCQERVSFHRRTPAPGVLKPEKPKPRSRRYRGPIAYPMPSPA
jgi:hypothetical protein